MVSFEGDEESNFDDVTAAKTRSTCSEMSDSAVYNLVQVNKDGNLMPSASNEFEEVEEFLDNVHPFGDHVENVISTPNDEIPFDEIGVGSFVTGNEFMEVENVLEHLHPIGESEKNVIFTGDDEILSCKTDDRELVTARNNELVEVEDFLKDVHPAGDSKENVMLISKDDVNIANELDPCTNDVLLGDFFDDVNAVRDNEQNDICPSGDGISTSQCEGPEAVVEKAIAQQNAKRTVEESNGQPEGIVSSSATEPIDSHINQSGTGGEYSKSVDEPLKSELLGPSGGSCTSSIPDFSKLKGKICLDNLSVRELQETFRAAFGRETSVKDKQWLKRRLSMGLSNSCHILSMTFVIDQGNKVKIVQEESTRLVEDTLAEDLLVGEMDGNSGGFPIGANNQSEDPENVSGERLINPSAGHDFSSEDQRSSGVGTKRVRKPTKRYIEELSELESRESNGNLISICKYSGHGNSSSKPGVKPVSDAQSIRRPLVTRRDSLGGSGVEVPYVCRIRRSRPRENYMAFMKLQPGSMDVTTKLVQVALDSCGPLDDDRENKVFSSGLDYAMGQKPIVNELEKERQCQERETCEPDKDDENIEPRQGDPIEDDSDNDTPNVGTTKGGIRRKHHRPWSLTEVVNLVEGVARFGIGRWSEIKRLSFASHSYRTSVDLKDKWRNLLRASFARPAAGKGNFRKQVSAPIPPQILVRVRELAKMHSHVPPIANLSNSNGGNVHSTSPGYL